MRKNGKNYFSHFCIFKIGPNALLKKKNLFSSFYFYLWVKTKCDEIIIEQNWKRMPACFSDYKMYVKSTFFFFLDKNNTIFIHFNSFFNYRNTEMKNAEKREREREKIVDWIKSICNPFQSYFTKSSVNENNFEIGFLRNCARKGERKIRRK